MKKLSELLRGVQAQLVSGDLAVQVREVVADSRNVEAGDVFVCLPGYQAEGGEQRADCHDFIPMALQCGALALVVDRDVAAPAGVTVVRVADCWATLAAMACEAFDHPAQALTMVGVTGTSGKTSTTYFVASVLRHGGRRSARFGTIEYRFGEELVAATQTTPEAPELQRLLRKAVDDGFDSVVMEVSSHALELHRVGGVAFDVGVFTNFSQDHLNFHPTMEAYLRAKSRLFEGLGSGGKDATAVVNVDDPMATRILGVNRGRALTFGFDRRADVRATEVNSDLRGTRFLAHTPIGALSISLPQLGEFHVHNALAAIATGVALGVSADSIVTGLAASPAVPGRFELVDCGQDFVVAVDYAHKPDALRRLLESVRHLHPRRIITVFGCGGDRDRGKRPQMGQLAAQLSDVVIVTSDNPRSEPPEQILEEILAGARAAQAPGCELFAEVDRARAIDMAIQLAAPSDTVLIAGKGHETYQLFAKQRLDFDDREVARAALQRRLAD